MEITIKLEASRDLIAALLSLAGYTQVAKEKEAHMPGKERSCDNVGKRWTVERKEYLRTNFTTLRLPEVVATLNRLPGPPITYAQASSYAGTALKLRKNSTDPRVIRMHAALAEKRAAKAA